MTIITMTAPCAPPKTHVINPPGLPTSGRLVTTPTSTLTVGAAPWRHAGRLANLAPFTGHCVYILTGAEARIGKTGGAEKRLRDHRKSPPMPRIDEVFVIGSEGFTSDTISALEAILTQAARKAGVMPIIGAPLRVPSLDPARDYDLLRWLAELPPMLMAAGCALFESDYAPMPDRNGELMQRYSADPATQLSALLRGAADIITKMPAPTPDLMRRAIRGYTGRRCPTVEAIDIAGLDLLDLAAALRPNVSPASCVTRLKRASSAKNTPVDDTTPLLADLAGYGEARQWSLDSLSDIGAVLQGKLSAGELESAIFYGPPGTGKTLLARSLARTSRLPLIQTSVSSWFHHNTGHLGDVLQKIDDIFSQAKNSAPSIIFLDELDAIPDRNNLDSRSRDWWNSLITSVLLQIDAARNTKRGVIILAATNHLDHIDAALLRPGRFDRQFRIDPPDTAGLAGIMRSHLGADCPDADLVALARLMPGATGADVTGVIRTARRHARNENRALSAADLKAAILPADDRSPDDLRHVAIHEAGHAIVAVALGFDVPTVSIKGAGGTGGWTDIKVSPVSTREAIERRVMVLLAGRAANVAFGSLPDTGALSDLSEATRLLGAARTAFGLGDALVVRARPDDVLGLNSGPGPDLTVLTPRQAVHILRRIDQEPAVWSATSAIFEGGHIAGLVDCLCKDKKLVKRLYPVLTDHSAKRSGGLFARARAVLSLAFYLLRRRS